MAISIKTFEHLSDAASALAAEGSAKFFGGGTFIMRGINQANASVSTIIRTTDAALRQIHTHGARLEIGAGVTMAQVLASDDLDFLHPAASAVGGPAIRTMATVGGNLFAHSPFGDFTVALLALGGKVAIAGARNRSEVDLADFLANIERYGKEIVSNVSVERPSASDTFRFLKVSRVNPKRVGVITIAAHLPMPSGRIQGARVAYGAMAPRPLRVAAVERELEGKALDAAGIEAAVAVAVEGCTPVTDPVASDWYRREVAPVHLRRLLQSTA